MISKDAIGIIGMGWVGTSVAISILQKGICQELLLNDVKSEIAEGEAMDLTHGSSFYPSARVRSAAIEEMTDCKAIVVTAGRGGTSGETRLDLLEGNVKIVKQISEKLAGFTGFLIVVANPVDVLTYFYQRFTGLESNKVIGTGTMLDSARLRSTIGSRLDIDAKSIHANVIGEHGDSEVVLWSSARVGGIRLADWSGWKREYEKEIADEVRTAAYEIIKRKGATNHAIGLVTATLLKWIFRAERRVVTLSSMISGPHGLSDVVLSLPSVISNRGIEQVLAVSMNEHESEQLQHSAAVIKEAIGSVS
ncbi:MAG: L-lactate dehydrogenase [Bacteroidota bacterium]